jgi:hypothetical protein
MVTSSGNLRIYPTKIGGIGLKHRVFLTINSGAKKNSWQFNPAGAFSHTQSHYQ